MREMCCVDWPELLFPHTKEDMSFSLQLADAVRRVGNPLCVGLDPRWESLPQLIRATYADGTLQGIAKAYEAFCIKVIQIVARRVAVVKPQAAFFEACGPEGFVALQNVLRAAKSYGLLTILDSKRGDIASTATAYAEAAFTGPQFEGRTLPVWGADSLTVNPYLGEDAVQPFLDTAKKSKKGVFVLVRTSNSGSGLFQNLVSEGKPLYRHVAEAVARWNESTLNESGWGDVGAVIGATHPAELAELRSLLPHSWFLVPGFGAQGGTAEDVRPAFLKGGLGAVINSSRGITFPFSPEEPQWEKAIQNALEQTIAQLRSVAS